MSIQDVIILSFVQGVTEFIPVSSSGHLVAARLLFGIPDVAGTSFDAFLHLGTLAAVLLYYWRVWLGIFRSLFIDDTEGRDKRELVAKLALATVPTAVIGYAFYDNVDALLRSPYVVGAGLLITAAALFLGDMAVRKKHDIKRASFRDAAYIGLAQIISLVPGISRSGVTIAAGRWRGLDRKQATSFSFLMSAPIIAGAGLSGFENLIGNGEYSLSVLLLGFSISFLAGIASIHALLRLVQRSSFTPFAVYAAALAVLLFIL